MNKTRIDWCDMTYNPVTGCLHGCKYCYARKIAGRFGNKYLPYGSGINVLETPIDGESGIDPYPFGFEPTFHRYRLDEPGTQKRSRNIFVCSMADLFGEWVPDSWIEEVFKACEAAPQHRYLFLTKNPKRYGQINGWDHRYDYGYAKSNWWLGMTITGGSDIINLKHLPYVKANTFISIEPIESEIKLSPYLPAAHTKYKCSYCGRLADKYSLYCSFCGKEGGYSGSFRKRPINWVVIGAETGNRKDKVIPKREWIYSIANECKESEIPLFMKSSLRELMGDDFIQQFPWEVQK
ncbi:MAG TPA: DUF5131 family protein [Candidatus Omnitrophota bacterium]|nr:DUF5131 family protein [Candidatus Omnitrophota bacterium]